jgi:predicted transcriptional regulator
MNMGDMEKQLKQLRVNEKKWKKYINLDNTENENKVLSTLFISNALSAYEIEKITNIPHATLNGVLKN